MSTLLKLPYIQKVEERGNLQVWIVDGSYIRGHVDEGVYEFWPALPISLHPLE